MTTGLLTIVFARAAQFNVRNFFELEENTMTLSNLTDSQKLSKILLLTERLVEINLLQLSPEQKKLLDEADLAKRSDISQPPQL